MSEKKKNFAFGKENYKWMLIGLGVLLLGFVIMSMDKEQHGQIHWRKVKLNIDFTPRSFKSTHATNICSF